MKSIVLTIIIFSLLLVSGCIRAEGTVCNYDGICQEWETDDCVDCRDVAGRGVPIPTGEVVRPPPGPAGDFNS